MTCWRLVGHVKVQTLDAREDSKIDAESLEEAYELFYMNIQLLNMGVLIVCSRLFTPSGQLLLMNNNLYILLYHPVIQ